MYELLLKNAASFKKRVRGEGQDACVEFMLCQADACGSIDMVAHAERSSEIPEAYRPLPTPSFCMPACLDAASHGHEAGSSAGADGYEEFERIAYMFVMKTALSLSTPCMLCGSLTARTPILPDGLPVRIHLDAHTLQRPLSR